MSIWQVTDEVLSAGLIDIQKVDELEGCGEGLGSVYRPPTGAHMTLTLIAKVASRIYG